MSVEDHWSTPPVIVAHAVRRIALQMHRTVLQPYTGGTALIRYSSPFSPSVHAWPILRAPVRAARRRCPEIPRGPTPAQAPACKRSSQEVRIHSLAGTGSPGPKDGRSRSDLVEIEPSAYVCGHNCLRAKTGKRRSLSRKDRLQPANSQLKGPSASGIGPYSSGRTVPPRVESPRR